MNATLLLSLLFGLVDRADRIAKLLEKAKAEGRDVSSAELDQLALEDDQAAAALKRAIEDARKP